MKVLVYIPCHTDFRLALDQATKVKKEFQLFKSGPNGHEFELEIILSVNAYLPTAEEKKLAEQINVSTIYNGEGYLADINIASGYLIALSKKPEYLWILSVNDNLKENAFIKILEEFIKERTIDLLVTNSLNLDITFIEKQILDPSRTGFSYGLISGVVYKLERLFPYLHNGPFMSWTGWSQLAVMQSAMDGLGGLKVKTIPFNHIYQQRERDLESAATHYGHSVFGMLILGSIFKQTERASRKFIIRYIFKNFYIWHLYSRNWKYSTQLVSSENYLGWNQKIAESLILKSSRVTYLFYKFIKTIPFEKFNNNYLIIYTKRNFDKILNQSKHYEL
jgi:hypothetical protein